MRLADFITLRWRLEVEADFGRPRTYVALDARILAAALCIVAALPPLAALMARILRGH